VRRFPARVTVRTAVAGAAVLLALGPSCSATPAQPAPSLSVIPDDPRSPYVVTAIDYHFHDAHPSSRVSEDRALVFKSASTNRHNVTIEGTTYSRDLPPLGELRIARVGTVFPQPGRYRFFCKYHVDRGMRGVLVVVAPSSPPASPSS
jgi:hypothetical protein